MPTEFAFVPNIANWEREFQLPGGMVERHVRKIAEVTVVDARFTAPVRTGLMRSTIFAAPSGATEWKVTSPQPYTIFVHDGTRPHPIFPKGPGYPLRFFWPKVGRMVAFMSVLHPGTKPQPFLTDSLHRAMVRFTSKT